MSPRRLRRLLPTATASDLRKSIRSALHLMSARDRMRWRFVVAAQVATGLLDLVGVILMGLVGVIAGAAMLGDALPPSLARVTEWASQSGLEPVALVMVAGMTAALFFITKSALSAILLRRIFRFLADRQSEISSRLAVQLFSRPITEIESRSSQETAFALTVGVYSSVLALLGSYAIVLSELTLLALLGGALLIVDPVATIAALVFFGVVARTIHRLLSDRSAAQGGRIATATIDSNLAIQEGMAAYREILVLGRFPHYLGHLRTLLTRRADAQADSTYIAQIPRLVYEAALVLGACALALWQFVTGNGVEAVAMLALFLAAGSRVMPSLLRLNSQLLAIRTAAAQAHQAFDLAASLEVAADESMAHRSESVPVDEVRLAVGPRTYPGFVPTIALDNVDYSYGGRSGFRIQGVSLVVPSGTALALVGTTGAGKSTIADLMMGIIEPESGNVQIGHVSPREAIRRWPGAISYVPQNVTVVNGTVRENVAIALPSDEIDDGIIWEALRSARLEDFVLQSSLGLDLLVGERGARMSGGQKQRLGLARALYSKPRLLVLDEATSALDADTETAISETIRRLTGEVTTVTIAHRLATIRSANQVAFIENGRLAAMGTFSEVRAMNPDFDRQAHLLGIVR